MINNAIPRLKTINECASLTKLAKYHIRQLVLQKKIKCLKSGKKYLVNVQSLIDYLNQGDTIQETKEV